MGWIGIVLSRRDENSTKAPRYCVQFDKKRKGWELPKGGPELARPRLSTGCIDSSPFATGRGELWEEAGGWLAWREPGFYTWVSPTGSTLTSTPAKCQSAFLCTELCETDVVVPNWRRRDWMTLQQFAARSMRLDHVELLQRLQATPETIEAAAATERRDAASVSHSVLPTSDTSEPDWGTTVDPSPSPAEELAAATPRWIATGDEGRESEAQGHESDEVLIGCPGLHPGLHYAKMFHGSIRD